MHELIDLWEREAIFWASLVEASKIYIGPSLVVGLLNQHRICKPRRVKRLFNEVTSEEFIYLILQGLIPLNVITRRFFLIGFLSKSRLRWWHITAGSIPSIFECFQANTFKFSLREVEIVSLNSLERFFPSLSTFADSFSSIGRSTRSSMSPVVASSSDDLGSIVSLRGPSLGGHYQ